MNTLAERIGEVLGINCRNIDYIAPCNDRQNFRFADDKLMTKEVLTKAGIPQPSLLAAYRRFWEVDGLERDIAGYEEFVMKPARGLGGCGILILAKQGPEKLWHTPSHRRYTLPDLSSHAVDILYGVFSIDNTTDAVIIEERIHPHRFFRDISPAGIADIRIIVHRHRTVMAMCRIPTLQSDGKANISLGAVGAGIDIGSGTLFHAVTKKGPVKFHPDTRNSITGRQIPCWHEILDIAHRIQDHVPLGYLGLDIVLDERYGPLVLEINTRPGLEIQNANRRGLRGVLEGKAL